MMKEEGRMLLSPQITLNLKLLRTGEPTAPQLRWKATWTSLPKLKEPWPTAPGDKKGRRETKWAGEKAKRDTEKTMKTRMRKTKARCFPVARDAEFKLNKNI